MLFFVVFWRIEGIKWYTENPVSISLLVVGSFSLLLGLRVLPFLAFFLVRFLVCCGGVSEWMGRQTATGYYRNATAVPSNQSVSATKVSRSPTTATTVGKKPKLRGPWQLGKNPSTFPFICRPFLPWIRTPSTFPSTFLNRQYNKSYLLANSMKGTRSGTFAKAVNGFAPTGNGTVQVELRRGGRKRKENQFYQDEVNSTVDAKDNVSNISKRQNKKSVLRDIRRKSDNIPSSTASQLPEGKKMKKTTTKSVNGNSGLDINNSNGNNNTSAGNDGSDINNSNGNNNSST